MKINIDAKFSEIFWALLSVAFIVLKLTNVVDWSWWIVLLPVYSPIVLVILIVIVTLIVARIKGRH